MTVHIERRILSAVILGLFIHPSAGLAGTVVGSRHDLSSATSPEVCVWCHTTHNANTTTDGPLWNRSRTTAVFDVYSSSTMGTNPGIPSAESLLCLGCHDGVLSPDQAGYAGNNNKHSVLNYHGSPDTTSYQNCERCHSDLYSGRPRTLVLGTNLGDDHPISMNYPTPAEDPDFNTPPDPQNGWGEHNIRLVNGRVECVSCHDVHNPDIPPFLNVSNSGSALCFTCHAK